MAEIGSLHNIGNPIKFDFRTDPLGEANKKFKRAMNVVDLIPVDYVLNLGQFNDSEDNKGKYRIKYDFDPAITRYQTACKRYGLDYNISGLRMWLTADSISQEEISNNFDKGAIQSGLSTISSTFGSVREIAKATGSQTTSSINDVFKDLSSATGGNPGIQSALKTFGNALILGKHFALPKVWKESAYNPSLALNVKLISPYGSSASIQKHVVEPLVKLLLLCSPVSDDGLTYGDPKHVFVKAYGITNINLGYVESISMSRGGADTTYNVWRQPLNVNLTINIKPALTGFASMWDATDLSVKDIAGVGDASITEGKSLPNFGPGITTVGNIINSFKPVPVDIEPEFVGTSNSPSPPSINTSQTTTAGSVPSPAKGLVDSGIEST